MISKAGFLLAATALAGLGASGMAQAQTYSWAAYPVPHFYLGGGIGAATYADDRGGLANSIDGNDSPGANLAAGDYLSSDSGQDRSAFGAKVYGGAWLTPYLGLEAGYVWLGSINYSVLTSNQSGSFAVSDGGHVQPSLWYESLLLGIDYGGLKAYGKAGAYQSSVNISDNSFNLVNGAVYGASQTFHNSGAVLGLGLQAPSYYRGAWRLELEDYLSVGPSSASTVPAWRGNVLLLSAGYNFLF